MANLSSPLSPGTGERAGERGNGINLMLIWEAAVGRTSASAFL